MKILVIEDNEAAAQSLGVILHMRWPDAIVVNANTGTQGIDLFCTTNPDLVILDLGLPDIDGFDVLKEIRTISNTPIIIVTARSTHDNIIRGLELGADDYIVKPYDYLECLARVQALIRRLHVSVQGQPIVCGQFRLDNDMRSLCVNDKQTNLTHTEGVILRELIRNVGRAVSMDNLCNQIWGSTYPGAQDSIRVYIRRIREKIENNPNHPIFIITKPGIGYYLSEVVKKDSLE